MGNSNFSLAINCIENYEMEQDLEESTTIQLIWEYQRFQEGFGWGAGPNFLSDDPGRFSSYDRKIFGATLQSVDPGVPSGYEIDLVWSVVFQKKSKFRRGIGSIDETSISDRFGWHYSKSFYADKWSAIHEKGFDVRRRSWRRTLILKNENSEHNHKHFESSL